MAKYNNQDNDEYLLKHNLLEIECFTELERAESFVFSLRTASFECGEFVLQDFTIEELKNCTIIYFKIFTRLLESLGMFN